MSGGHFTVKRKGFLLSAIGAIAAASFPRAVVAEPIWAIRCSGDEGRLRWLQGNPASGSVDLVAGRDLLAGSTSWEVYRDGPGVVMLRCLAGQDGPRWLDGRTLDGTVGLAPVTTGIYTGTRWQIYRGKPDSAALKCLGIREGPRWLRGRTRGGAVDLTRAPGAAHTETSWHLVPLTREDG